MNSARILNIVNVLLVLVCLACVYYLATASYVKPAELTDAEQLLGGEDDRVETTQLPGMASETTQMPGMTNETNHGAPPRGATPDSYGGLSKALMRPLFTPTPTPTPPPPPPPAPPNLEVAVNQWAISSILDEQTVEFTNNNSQETFTMTLNGPPKMATDSEGREVPVTLTAVDMMELKATLSFGEQRVVKAF